MVNLEDRLGKSLLFKLEEQIKYHGGRDRRVKIRLRGCSQTPFLNLGFYEGDRVIPIPWNYGPARCGCENIDELKEKVIYFLEMQGIPFEYVERN